MRTFKFRAWEHDSESMWDWWKLGGFAQNGIHRDFENIYTNQERYELMQFTGLLDKKGKEIYESDIVEIDGSPVEVEWYAGAWTVQYFTTPTRSYLSQFDESDVKIIGNVFENPNLLTTTHTEKEV